MVDGSVNVIEKPFYSRILLKLSGEALMGNQSYGIDLDVISELAEQIREVCDLGVQVALVIGGGNIFRGVSAASRGMDRATADYMGMLATVMNGLALQQALGAQGLDARVLSAIDMKEVAERYIRQRAVRHLEKGRVVIFAAGTGLPFFTTDTTAALRAVEIGAQIIMKATKVDGVYDSDPEKDSSAVKYDRVSFSEVLRKNLGVMDATAISLARDQDLRIVVFSMRKRGNIKRAILGEPVGTMVEGQGYVE